jgi:hypothetical protein
MTSRFFAMSLAFALAAMVGVQAGSALAAGKACKKGQCDDQCDSGHCRKHLFGHCHHCGQGHGGNRKAAQHAGEEWACGYYHTMWGQPVALIVPPTAELQTHWNWGVAQTSVTPIWPQFSREFPGPYYGGRGFAPTPRWPSSTDQFGVYYVRGPW